MSPDLCPSIAMEMEQIKSVTDFDVLLKVHSDNEANVSIVTTMNFNCTIKMSYL